MPQFEVTSEEWKIAHDYLDNKPDGTKLPYSVVLTLAKEVVASKRFENAPAPYQTFHSFIKKDGEILAFQRGHIKEGSINTAKYAIDEKGELYVVKIGDPASIQIEDLKEDEIATLADLELSKGTVQRRDKDKRYVFMRALGVSLKHLFVEGKLPKGLEDRLDMAIQLTWKLYRLHEGFDSVTGTRYAHMDIKPDNITRTEDGQLHFIDFGMATENPKQLGEPKTKACGYIAFCDKVKNQVLTYERYDVVAAKRVIYLPDSMYSSNHAFNKVFFSDLHKSAVSSHSLLSEQELEQFQLTEYISTFAKKDEQPDYTKDKTTAVMLCAMLINARHNLKINNKWIAIGHVWQHAITGFYISGQIDRFSELVNDHEAMMLMAALNGLDKHALYDAYSQDASLRKALVDAESFEVMCTLVGLKMRGLEAYYETVLRENHVAAALFNLIREERTFDEQDLLGVLADQSGNTAKAILFLAPGFFDARYKETIQNPALASALANIASRDCAVAVIRMLKLNFTHDEIIRVSQDVRIGMASGVICSNRYLDVDRYGRIIRLMIAETDTVDACLNMNKVTLNQFQKFEILTDVNKAKTFNFLFANGIKDTKTITRAALCDVTTRVFVYLQERNMKALYWRALNDKAFSKEVMEIFLVNFANEVTQEMLSNDWIRHCLKFVNSYRIEAFQGFKIMVDTGLIYLFMQRDLETLQEFNFMHARFLARKELSFFASWLIEYPGIRVFLNAFFLKKDISSPAGDLFFILGALPESKRLQFIKEVAKVLDITLLKNDMRYLKKITSSLPGDDKRMFLKMIYSDKELADRQIIKNIKSTIKKTPWERRPLIHIVKSSLQVSVPREVEPQAHVLQHIAAGEQTYSAGVEEIKALGRKQFEAENTIGASIYHTLFAKSPTTEYFEKFETDESFEQAFGAGSSPH